MFQIYVASAAATAAGAAATAAGVWLTSYQQRLRSIRQQQILIRGLKQVNSAPPVSQRQFASANQAEMETLLENIRIAAEELVASLTVEEQIGTEVSTSGPDGRRLFVQWQGSRRANERAHEVYNQAVQEYREFLHSLAPPQRAEAAKRGCIAMIVART
jgi:hypothetical protein